MFWPNQYDNPVICEAYEKTIGSEISILEKLDYLFIAVSTCGTISGISRAVKKTSRNSNYCCGCRRITYFSVNRFKEIYKWNGSKFYSS